MRCLRSFRENEMRLGFYAEVLLYLTETFQIRKGWECSSVHLPGMQEAQRLIPRTGGKKGRGEQQQP